MVTELFKHWPLKPEELRAPVYGFHMQGMPKTNSIHKSEDAALFCHKKENVDSRLEPHGEFVPPCLTLIR